MVTLKIDERTVCVPEGTTILDAALSAGIQIPHLCYLKEINEIGACRLCCVQVEGEEKLIPACNNVVAEGMKISTNSPPGPPGTADQPAADPQQARCPVRPLRPERQLPAASRLQRAGGGVQPL